MRGTASAHIVFSVDFEESVFQPVRVNRGKMFMLETGADKLPGRSRHTGGAAALVDSDWRCSGEIGHGHPISCCRLPDQDFWAVSEPWPPPGTTILVQVPP